jgi:membrane protease YdiL (CAAX protease family)
MSFCSAFLVLLTLTAVMRQTVTNPPPIVFTLIVCMTCTALAVVLLWSKAAHVFGRPPVSEQADVLNWSWSQTLRLVPVTAAILWGLPLAYAGYVGAPTLRAVNPNTLLLMLAIQVMLVGLSEELFFCEAGLKGWAHQPLAGLALTSLASFVFHLHLGLWQALITCSAGLVYGGLRIAGADILAVALLHGLTQCDLLAGPNAGPVIGTTPARSVHSHLGAAMTPWA